MFYEKFSGNSFTYLRFVFSMLVLIPPYEIHESQLVRRLFFRQPGHAKYSKNLIEYEITLLKNDKDVLKVLIQFNYGKRLCPI